jgi:hypothetical protein
MTETIIARPEFFGKAMAKWGDQYREAFEKAAIRAVFSAAQMGKRKAVTMIGLVTPRQPVDTGEMRRSYVVRMVYLRASKQWAAELSNVAKHAAIMEYGARPHTTPLEPLIRWAERKLRKAEGTKAKPRRKSSLLKRLAKAVVKDVKKALGIKAKKATRGKSVPGLGRRPSKKQLDRLSAAKKLAGAAWRAIQDRGIEPRGFHADAEKYFPVYMEAAMRKELARIR